MRFWSWTAIEGAAVVKPARECTTVALKTFFGPVHPGPWAPVDNQPIGRLLATGVLLFQLLLNASVLVLPQ